MSNAIVWFRADLRVDDNAALAEAIQAGHTVIPLFIWAPHEEAPWEPGGASQWWRHHALADLDSQLRAHGTRLVVRRADVEQSSGNILQEIARKTKATTVYWNRRVEPAISQRDARVEADLRESGLEVTVTSSDTLFQPHEIVNQSGKPFKVFTPMWRHCSARQVPRPVRVPLAKLVSPRSMPRGDTLKSLHLLPKISWDGGLAEFWGTPTRLALKKRLGTVLSRGPSAYSNNRDRPAVDGTTQLSPYLHHGQIGARELWWRLADAETAGASFTDGLMRQIVWRDFAYHTLYHNPHTTDSPLREEFADFPWQISEEFLTAWQRGRTGYPIVDAGLRQLWQTGWMHNRVRMIVASLLVKHLLQPWTEGARWFWDTLVDADLPNNTFGWQWVAGCGADAAPYFRIFNPITQGERFDPDGVYVRHYLPELARIPAKFIHRPWELSELELADCQVVLDRDYPKPVISHPEGRQRALEAFQVMRERRDKIGSP